LQGLHISGFVVFPNEWAIRLIPFQNNIFSLQIGETMRLSIRVRQSKVRGGFPDFCLGEAQAGHGGQQSTTDQ
jgi:hypothetical protein